MSAGSFDTRRNMILTRPAKTGNIAFMLAAMTAMLPNWLRRSSRPKANEKPHDPPKPLYHYSPAHAALSTAHLRCSSSFHHQGKRAMRRNRFRAAATQP